MFWKKRIKGYLLTICRGSKWIDDTRLVDVGDLVVVAEEGVKNRWLVER